MKKCPFCNAELEENARFCLYCMASLDEKSVISAKSKKKSAWLLFAAVLTVIVTAVVICISASRGNNPSESGLPQESLSSEGESSQQSVASDTNTDVGNTENTRGEASNVSSIETSVDTGAETSIDTSTETSGDTSVDTSVDTSGGDNEGAGTNMPQPLQPIVYKYRDAILSDEMYNKHSLLENAVTITGVETVSENGVYVIPDTIDGKKVVAIASFAFCDEKIKDSVKTVIVPESVKNIHNYAFSACSNMTDLYLCGEAVAGSHNLWIPPKDKQNQSITIHCSETCHDRNLRKHKNNILYSYEGLAKYEEWNGWE